MSNKWINKLTRKDEAVLRSFANVGHLSHKMLSTDLDLAERRIKAFEHDNYIERKDFYNKKTHNVEQVYRLTDKGKQLIKDELSIKYFYRSNSPQHDLQLAERYLQEPEKNRSNWITENEWRDIFKTAIESLKTTDYDRYKELIDKLAIGEISCVDGGFRTSEGLTAIEVVTQNYDATDRAAKIEFAHILNAELQLERG